jgi:hypothetical protein
MSEQRDLTKERDARCIPLVKELFAILGSFDLPLGSLGVDMNADKVADSYIQSAQTIFPIFRKDQAMRVQDVDYVKRLALEAIEKTFLVIDDTLAFKYDLAEARKWGYKDSKDINKVTLAQVEDYLNNGEPIPENKSQVIPKKKWYQKLFKR